MIKITKGFAFEAAHRLSNYDGKCAMFHGHNYKGIVSVSGEVDYRGIVIDFSDLKKIIKEYIVGVFDHRTIAWNTEENRRLTKEYPQGWVVWVGYNPTAENMAKDFAERIESHVGPEYLVQVELFETDDSSAIAK